MAQAHRRIQLVILAALALVVSPAARAQRDAEPQTTALDRYVAAPDDSFDWKVVTRDSDEAATTLLVDLTSQTWRSPGEVDRQVWKHWLWIVVPHDCQSDVAMLMIGGGANDGHQPEHPDGKIRAVALATGSVVAALGQVPNQPLEFFGDGKPRYEDDLLARSWRAALAEHDMTWLGQLPMAKSAVRAMDAVQAALAVDEQLPAVERFVVAGGSKRGWTTWLTAIVDDRVAAIAPIVIDVLNIRESMRNHHDAYGFWAPAVGDYERAGLLDEMDDPVITPLLQTVDPYVYRQRLTMPKCVINASGDQFFTPDSSQFYFDELPGDKLLCYVPNADHSLRDSTALETLTAFHASIVHGLPRPRVQWEEAGEAAWRVTSTPAPTRAVLWTAHNPTARDFRADEIGAAYKRRELTASADGWYEAAENAPAAGFTASFIELEFDIGAPTPLRATTPVRVVGSKSEAATGSTAGGN